jgi:hypothetical protein
VQEALRNQKIELYCSASAYSPPPILLPLAVVAAYSCLTESQASIQLGGRPPGAHLAKRECAGWAEEREGCRLGLLSEEWSRFNNRKQYSRESLTSHSALGPMPVAQNCWGRADVLDHDLQQDHRRARYRCLRSQIQLSCRCSLRARGVSKYVVRTTEVLT